jgi:hypothetical protein
MKTKLFFIISVFSVILLTNCTKETIVKGENDTGNFIAKGTIVTDIPNSYKKFSELASLKRGDMLKLRLNRQDEIVEEFDISFEGLYENKGYRYIFCKTPSNLPIGSGDSGSPVLTTDGKVIGALAIGFYENTNQFAATPIEDVMAVDSVSENSSNSYLYNSKQIGLSFMAIGFSEQFIKRAKTVFPQEDFNNLNFIQSQQKSKIKSAKISTNSIPGSSIAVMVVNGDIVKYGAIGTATFSIGNKMWGFGHSMFGEKPSKIPVYSVDMTTLIVSEGNASKLGLPTNNLIGALIGDQGNGILVDKSITPEAFSCKSSLSVFDSIESKPLYDSIVNHKIAKFSDSYDEYRYASMTQMASIDNILGYPIYAKAIGECIVTFDNQTTLNIAIDTYLSSDIAYYIYNEIRYKLSDSNYNPNKPHIKSINLNTKIFVMKSYYPIF